MEGGRIFVTDLPRAEINGKDIWESLMAEQGYIRWLLRLFAMAPRHVLRLGASVVHHLLTALADWSEICADWTENQKNYLQLKAKNT